jgi:predicted nucleic acid-binding Zn ribbon protein
LSQQKGFQCLISHPPPLPFPQDSASALLWLLWYPGALTSILAGPFFTASSRGATSFTTGWGTLAMLNKNKCYGCRNKYEDCTCTLAPLVKPKPTCPSCGKEYSIGKNTEQRVYRCSDNCGVYFSTQRQVSYVNTVIPRKA